MVRLQLSITYLPITVHRSRFGYISFPSNIFYAPASIDRGHTVFGHSVCPYDCPQKTFKLAIAFPREFDSAFIFHIYKSWGKALSLVPKSRSSDKVKVKYQDHSFRKHGPCGGIRVSQTHLVFLLTLTSKNNVCQSV